MTDKQTLIAAQTRRLAVGNKYSVDIPAYKLGELITVRGRVVATPVVANRGTERQQILGTTTGFRTVNEQGEWSDVRIDGVDHHEFAVKGPLADVIEVYAKRANE